MDAAGISHQLSEILAGLADESRVKEDADKVCVNLDATGAGDLKTYSMFKHIAIADKLKLIEAAKSDVHMNRVMGSIVGMAVGDALGHPFEFEPAQDTPINGYFDLETCKFYNEANQFRLQRGQWTDDSAMGLCMADSLIRKRCFDGSDMRVRFWCWWNRAYNNAFRNDPSRASSVGLGGNISKSLYDIEDLVDAGEPVPPAYKKTGEDAGNGSLMRFTPIALFYHQRELPELYEAARASSYTTHPGVSAAEACAFLAHLIVRALQRPSGPVNAKEFLDKTSQEYLEISGLSGKSGPGYDDMKCLIKSSPPSSKESCWNWKRPQQDIAGTLTARGSTYNGYPVSSGYFGSYCIDGLALALWAVYHTTSFDEAVVRSVNLFGDADSHGSICGQLAGALYGYSTIKPQFIDWLNKWDDHDFALRGLLLSHLGARHV